MSLIKKMMNKYKTFRKDNKGATAIEYGLLAALISVGIIAGVRAIGSEVSSTFSKIGSELVTGG